MTDRGQGAGIVRTAEADSSIPIHEGNQHRTVSGGLGRSAFQGGALTVSSQALSFVLSLGATAVLARLITPQEFGVFAMAAVVTSLALVFREFGLGAAVIQNAAITRDQVSALFWINAGIGVTLTLAVVAIAPVVARFFGDPAVGVLAAVLGTSLLLGALGVQHRAILRRELRFGALTAVRLISTGAGVVAAVGIALLGGGYWALVAMPLTAEVVALGAVWVITGWRPSRPRRTSGLRPLLRFGRDLTMAYLIGKLARKLDTVLIGRFATATSLGLYSKAYHLLLMPVDRIGFPATAVAFPVLSRLQHEPALYRRYYIRGVMLMVSVSMPAIVFAVVSVDSLVLVFLGPRWQLVNPILLLLAPVALTETFRWSGDWVYASLGTVDRQMRWELIRGATTAAALAVGINWGASGVAVSLSVTSLALVVPGFAYCFRQSPLRLPDLGDALWRPVIAASGSGLILFMFRIAFVGDAGPLAALASSAVLFGLSYLLLWLMLPGGRSIAGELAAHARRTVKRSGHPLTAAA